MSANDFTAFDTSPTGIYGSIDFSTANLTNSTGFINVIQTAGLLDVTGIVYVPLYRIRGYNPITTQYESWVSVIPITANPSGATLIDVVVEAKLIETTRL